MSDETYRLMCSHPEIQGMWKPKLGDQVFSRAKYKIVLGLSGHYLEDLLGGFGCIWLPREGDWMEMLADWGVTISWAIHSNLVLVTVNNDGLEKFFEGFPVLEALCQAWMWTKGWRWERGEWRKR